MLLARKRNQFLLYNWAPILSIESLFMEGTIFAQISAHSYLLTCTTDFVLENIKLLFPTRWKSGENRDISESCFLSNKDKQWKN